MTNRTSRRNTFSKSEKLCSDKAIDRLFAKGESFIAYPLRVVFFSSERVNSESTTKSESNISILISVSKRKFKRAVKRNRVKRLIREAYRLNKHALYSTAEQIQGHTDIAFLYLKDELPTYAEIEKAMLKATNILSEKMNGQKDEKDII